MPPALLSAFRYMCRSLQPRLEAKEVGLSCSCGVCGCGWVGLLGVDYNRVISIAPRSLEELIPRPYPVASTEVTQRSIGDAVHAASSKRSRTAYVPQVH